MELSTILIILGIFCIVLSFFLKDTSKKLERDLEELSISIYQETNALKKRLKIVEEELLLEPNFKVNPLKTTTDPLNTYKQVATKQGNKKITQKPVNEILVRQVIELNKQGYSIEEISKMSTLSKEQIFDILQNGGI